MINPLKIPEMLSQANQMQEEIQRKLEATVVEGSSYRVRESEQETAARRRRKK